MPPHGYLKYGRDEHTMSYGMKVQCHTMSYFPREPIECGICNIVFGHFSNDVMMNDAIDKQLKHYDTDEHEIKRRAFVGAPPLICKLCNTKEYAFQAQLDKHCQLRSHKKKENIENGTMITCEVCPAFEAADQIHLAEHKMTKAHLAKMRDPYKCEFCHWFKPTKDLTHWNVHLKSNAHATSAGICMPAKPKKPHHCELCNRGFMRKAHLITHNQSDKHQIKFLKSQMKTKVVVVGFSKKEKFGETFQS